MSVEVRPVGVTCQLACSYCYEESMREQQRHHRYNREAVLEAIQKLPKNQHWSLFGGEALILPLADLEELLSLSHTMSGTSGIQTNGALITDKHIDLFVKYKTHVGISLDGPDELNDSRWAGTLDATRKQTQRTHAAIRALVDKSKCGPEYAHLLPSLIVTLHAGNCSAERFPRFMTWLHELDAMGIKHLNMHLMEMDHNADRLYLPQDELSERLIYIWKQSGTFNNLNISKFNEIKSLLRGRIDTNVVCHWKPCDPWNTSAVHGIENDGSPSHCSRTNKDGKNWLPAEGSGVSDTNSQFAGHAGTTQFERQMALYVTPQEHGGCNGCQYWLMCFGHCPGEGEKSDAKSAGDWRMRTSHCSSIKRLFAEGERQLKFSNVTPLTEHPRRQEMEKYLYTRWANGQRGDLAAALQMISSTPTSNSPAVMGHGDAPHADVPHRDARHTDVPHRDIAHGDKTTC